MEPKKINRNEDLAARRNDNQSGEEKQDNVQNKEQETLATDKRPEEATEALGGRKARSGKPRGGGRRK